jgi:hypothetical protein
LRRRIQHGNADADSDLSFFSLMSGSWESPSASHEVGWRIPVDALDAAVPIDLGVPGTRE